MMIVGENDKISNFFRKRDNAVNNGLNPETDIQLPMGGPVTDNSVNNPNQVPFDEISSLSDMVQQSTNNVPTIDTNEILGGGVPQLKMTEDPTRDAAQVQRLNKRAKLNAVSKGLQAVFGGLMAAGGESVPAPYDSPMTGFINQEMARVDDRYYRDLARVRDENLRKDIFNMNQQARAEEARIRQTQVDADRAFKEGQAEKAMELQKRGLDLRERQIKSDETHRRYLHQAGPKPGPAMIPSEHIPIVNKYVTGRTSELRTQMENEIDEGKRKALQDQIDDLQLDSFELLNPRTSRVYSDAIANENRQQQQGDMLKALENSITSGAYNNKPQALKSDLATLYKQMGKENAEDLAEANYKQLVENGYFTESSTDGKVVNVGEPRPEDFSTQNEYNAARLKYDRKPQKEKNIDGTFREAVKLVDDAPSLSKQYLSNKKSAVIGLIQSLNQRRETLPQGFLGDLDRYQIDQEVQKLEQVLKDL